MGTVAPHRGDGPGRESFKRQVLQVAPHARGITEDAACRNARSADPVRRLGIAGACNPTTTARE